MTRLMTASLGPEDRGRGYGVLQHSLDDAAWRRHRPMLEDFSLSLAAWADLEAEPFVALFPLDAEATAFALVRAAYLGRAELGTVAVANVVIVPQAVVTALDGRAHKLLALVPEASGAAFGASRIDLATAPLREPTARQPMPAFGLEWRDHVLDLTSGDPETTLVQALDSITPPIQRARVKGWSSTSALVVSGGFDPAKAFQLIIKPKGQPVGAASSHRLAPVRDSRVDAVAEPEPAAWRAWTVVQTVLREAGAVTASVWRPQDQTAPVETVVALELLQAALPLEPAARVALLASAVVRDATPPDLRAGMLAGAAGALNRIMLSAEPLRSGAYYLEGVLAALGPDETDAAAAFVAAAPLDGALDGLSARGRTETVEAGGLAALLRSPIAWPDVETASIEALLAACSERLARDAAARRLGGRLAGELSGRGPKARGAAVRGLAARLAAAPGADDVDLAVPPVASLVPDLESGARRDYCRRALFPILRGEAPGRRAATVGGLKAALTLV